MSDDLVAVGGGDRDRQPVRRHLPAKVTSPETGARTVAASTRPMSTPRCCPPAYGLSPSENSRRTSPSAGHAHAEALAGAAASDQRRPRRAADDSRVVREVEHRDDGSDAGSRVGKRLTKLLQRAAVERVARGAGEARRRARRPVAARSRPQRAPRPRLSDSLSGAACRSPASGAEHERDLAPWGLGEARGELFAAFRARSPRSASSARGTPQPADRASRAASRASDAAAAAATRRRRPRHGQRDELLRERLELPSAARQVADELVPVADEPARDERRLDRGRPRAARSTGGPPRAPPRSAGRRGR